MNITDYRDHLWDYFSLHAEQRLKTFHFYLILETALMGAVLIANKNEIAGNKFLLILGVLMTAFSIIFWKLDQRTRYLIKVSEEGLRGFEEHAIREFGFERTNAPFLNDPQYKSGLRTFPLIEGAFSYSKCFGFVFFIFGFIGVGLCLWMLTSLSNFSCGLNV